MRNSHFEYSSKNADIRKENKELDQVAQNWLQSFSNIEQSAWFQELKLKLPPNSSEIIAQTSIATGLTLVIKNDGLWIQSSFKKDRKLQLDDYLISKLSVNNVLENLLKLADKYNCSLAKKTGESFAESPSEPSSIILPCALSALSFKNFKENEILASSLYWSQEHNRQELLIKTTSGEFRTSRILFSSDEKHHTLNCKSFTRAISNAAAMLKQPNWTSSLFHPEEFLPQHFSLSEILKNLPLIGHSRLAIGDYTILLNDNELQILKSSHLLFTAPYNKSKPLPDELLKFSEGITVPFVKNQGEDNHSFLDRALKLGNQVYFKPENSCQGNGIFLVSKLNDEIVLTTDSLSLAKTIFSIKKDHLSEDSGTYEKIRLAAINAREGFVEGVARFLYNRGYMKRGSFEFKFADENEFKKLMLLVLDKEKWIAEEKIPIENFNGYKIEFRNIFTPRIDLEHPICSNYHQLAAHWAKLSKSKITLSHITCKNIDTIEMLKNLTYTRIDQGAQVQHTVNNYFDKHELHMSNMISLTKAFFFSPQVYAIDSVPVWNKEQSCFDFYLMEGAQTSGFGPLKIGADGHRKISSLRHSTLGIGNPFV